VGELLKLIGIPGTIVALLGLMGWTGLGAIKLWRELRGDRGHAADLTPLLQHLDLTVTEHFDQLRRDLETKIQTETRSAAKNIRNGLTIMLLQSLRRREDDA